MGAGGFLAAFTLLACLGAGTFFFQGVQAVRYRCERLNRSSAIVALVAAVAGVACFVARLGRWDRVFGMFGNTTSPTTLLLYAVVLFVVGTAVFLAVSLRTEDGSVARWCGVMALVVSVLLVGLLAFANYNYLHLSTLNPDFFALTGYYAANALALGSLVFVLMAGLAGDSDGVAFGRRAALVCVLANAALLAVFLGVFSLDSQGAQTASRSMFSMSTYTVKATAAASVTAADKLAVLLGGSSAGLFWGGAVACGLGVPLVASAVALCAKQPGRALVVILGLVALAGALTGSVCLRMCLQVLGV